MSKSVVDKNIVFIGMPGCGKTTIGKAVASKLSLNFYDVDECIVKKEGKLINEIFLQGETYFRHLESEVINELSKTSSSVIATGGGSVKNPSNMDVLKGNSIIFFINRPLENIIKDINTSSRPLLKEGIPKLVQLYEERYLLYKKYCDIEVTNTLPLENIIDKVLLLIEMSL